MVLSSWLKKLHSLNNLNAQQLQSLVHYPTDYQCQGQPEFGSRTEAVSALRTGSFLAHHRVLVVKGVKQLR
jgi:hypothetical protein